MLGRPMARWDRIRQRLMGGLTRVFRPRVARQRVERAIARCDRVIIAEADWVGIYGFLRPLVLALLQRPGIHCALVTRGDQAWPLARELVTTGPLSGWNWSLWPYEWLDDFPGAPSLLLSSQPFSLVAHRFTGIPKIQTLHGMADKRGELFGTERLRDFTHLLSMGPYVTRLAEQRLRDPSRAAPLHIVPTGCSKTDALLDGTWSKARVLEALRLPPDRPTVLYAPTWEKAASFERFGLYLVEQLCRLPINVLLKPHHLSLGDPKEPFLVEHGHGGKDWRRILTTFERRHHNLRWVKHASANPSLIAADALVSDGSGIVYEYLLLDRPLIFVGTFPVEPDAPLHKRFHEYADVAPGPSTLTHAVEQALAAPGARQGERQRVVHDIAYNPGRATAAAMAEIAQLLDPEVA